MGEIAEMMLDGTMDPETGEFNFDGADGPGWPMTGAEAAAYARDMGRIDKQTTRWLRKSNGPGEPAFKVTKAWRKKIEAFGALQQNDRYHWQVRKDGRVLADWWPHKSKFRIDGKMFRGNEGDLVRALERAAAALAGAAQ